MPATDDEPAAPPEGEEHGANPAVEAVEAVAEVVEEATTAPPPAWSRRLTAHLDGFDDAVDGAFDRLLRGRPAVDRLMYSVTELADFSLLWHLLAAARGLRSERDADAAFRLSGSLAVESAVVNGALKSLFRRERPVPEFERPHHLRIPLTTSLPSGHASSAFCAATLLADGRGRAARAGWYALAAVVASSRVHVKIHHASDVLGGVVVGLALGRVARRVWRLP